MLSFEEGVKSNACLTTFRFRKAESELPEVEILMTFCGFEGVVMNSVCAIKSADGSSAELFLKHRLGLILAKLLRRVKVC